ncbi:MAG: hypothetical protein V3T86_05370 [Planctomycetota bacterium]
MAATERDGAVRHLVMRGFSEHDARALKPGYISDYGKVTQRLLARHGLRVLSRAGLLSPRSNLIYYRHRLLIPIRDGRRVIGVAGTALDARRPTLLLPHGIKLPKSIRNGLEALRKRLEVRNTDPQLRLL